MSTVTYVEKDGQRIDITGLVIGYQRRCDDCGEYIAEGEGITGHVSVVVGNRTVATELWDAHIAHQLNAIADAQRRSVDGITPL
jgi:hypothetical protein